MARSRLPSLRFFLPTLALAGCPGPSSMDASLDGTTDAVSVADTAQDGSDVRDAGPQNLIETVPETKSWAIPGLEAQAYVVYTASNVPHIYAANRRDLARIHGFSVARDRFFVMDMARRLAQGMITPLFGQDGLRSDQQSRGTGMTWVTQKILENFTPEQIQIVDAFAAGINAYIDEVKLRHLAAPSEFELARMLLGFRRATDLMQPFARVDVAAVLATLVYQLGYETDDPGTDLADRSLATLFQGDALEALRRAGARQDLLERMEPPHRTSSAVGFGLERGTGVGPSPGITPGRMPAGGSGEFRGPHPIDPRTHAPAVYLPMLRNLTDRLGQIRTRLHRDEGFGSNSWAVMGRYTVDGAALLAGDGHLPLSVPPLFYQVGMDTKVLGGGDIEQIGLTIPGFPLMAVGTNGRVAWSQTQLGGDITDWYREEIKLDASGAPLSSKFQGTDRPLVTRMESYVIADVPALSSPGRTEVWNRYETFDGRWITAIEGRTVTATEALNAGETRVALLGDYVVPKDMDGDGVITATSFDYTGLDGANLIGVLDHWGKSGTVEEFRQASRGLVAYSQNIVAADSAGSILYTSYQAVPCRGYLPRNPDGTWATGAHPARLLDGTRFGGFRVPVTNGLVDEVPGATDPYACMVPFDQTPQAIDPDRGYVATANNDPGGASFDGSLTNDPIYTGGPWLEDWRATRISTRLHDAVLNHSASEDVMSAIQADTRSNLGDRFLNVLLEAVDAARTASAGTPVAGTTEARLKALYDANGTDYEAVATRLRAWQSHDYPTPSGVATFYHTPVPGETGDAVSTTLFNAWFGHFMREVWDDEGLPGGVFVDGGNSTKVRTLILMLDGRDTDNAAVHLGSYNPTTRESAFFDKLGTPEVETSREDALNALNGSLTFLRSDPPSPGRGGFGAQPMDSWIWGLRHWVSFDSILSSFFDTSGPLGGIARNFSITPTQLPLATGLTMGDPRFDLPGFPRQGDQYAIDAANPGLEGSDFTFGYGPNFRMVIALRPNGTTGRNVIPGGQSAITTSMYFDDQAAMWLGNQTMPMLLTGPAVVAGAIARETFTPAP